MAPIPRLASAAGPLSIITSALFGAFSGPNSSPPTNGSAAAVWDTKYTGTASFFNLTTDTTPASLIASPTSSKANSTTAPTSPSLVYFNTAANTFTGCDNATFYGTDNVALINPLQFGNVSSTNSTCGQWIQVFNRVNTDESIYAKIVGVCDDCEYGSVALNREALEGLSYETPFELMVFDDESELTIGNLTDPSNPLDPATNPISPKNLLNIVWNLSKPPKPDPASSSVTNPQPTKTTPAAVPATTTATTTTKITTTTTTKTTTTTTSKSTPKPTSNPGSGTWYTGRATWYSDTHGQCEHNYSQSDMIVAVNEAQMGGGTKICGKKILVTEKGSNTQVVVTVVDMCPSQYCNFGDLDLSQGAFKKFAGLGVGVLKLTWQFI
ncbi:hypothetical protein KI688_000173 [Linnemannia hyalina]|uniref:RlpA-like protein double-psi beta-barrel domain-containing protein n=1 Tax=Linnemannia hyalina TaxID=64524 RepID=A0A9P7Y5T6_9FUNG|nr:hypothetical protein KI688_000173 [Linnemannia hyalina]